MHRYFIIRPANSDSFRESGSARTYPKCLMQPHMHNNVNSLEFERRSKALVEIVGKFRPGGGGIFPREIEHRRRFLLSYANAWLKIQSFSSDRYSLHRAHVNIICSYARRIYRLSLHCHFHHESSAIILEVSSAGIIHDSAVYPKFCFHYFFVPVFFSRQTIFDRQDSPIFSKSKGGRGGGKKKNVKTMENSITIRKLDLVCKKCIAHGQMRIIDE